MVIVFLQLVSGLTVYDLANTNTWDHSPGSYVQCKLNLLSQWYCYFIMQVLTFHLLFLLLICSRHAAGIAYMYLCLASSWKVVHRWPIGMSIRRNLRWATGGRSCTGFRLASIRCLDLSEYRPVTRSAWRVGRKVCLCNTMFLDFNCVEGYTHALYMR